MALAGMEFRDMLLYDMDRHRLPEQLHQLGGLGAVR
jgi:hypothetical protein